MRRFLTRFFVFVGVLATGLVVLSIAVNLFVLAPEPIPRNAILEIDLEPGLVEYVPDDPLLLTLERRRKPVREVVDVIQRGADDDRVAGLLVRGAHGGLGLGVVEELREAVLHFRESGKPAYLFSETLGRPGVGQGGYYLATAFDQIVLQPSGDVGVTGLAVEAPFLSQALEGIGIRFQGDQREEYKDALAPFLQDGFTEAGRESMTSLLEGIRGELARGMIDGRGLEEERVLELMDQGPFLALEAEDLGLVDRLGYRDQALQALRDHVGGDAESVSYRRYRAATRGVWDRGERVALIYGVGPIHQGESGLDPIMGGGSMGSETVARAIRRASDDPEVRAILLRVDSPGGSYVASDVVHRELVRAREGGIPIVVSMGNSAASGGYLISAPADRIVAQPSTITGSIGVAGGKPVTEELWEKLDVTWDRVEVGEGGGIWSPVRPFEDREWEHFQESLDRVYTDFKEMVAVGRGMSLDQVQEVARGRVWTGRQAMERGLVDDLGGLTTAVAIAREEADLAPDVPVELRLFPRERTLLEVLVEEGRSGVTRELGMDVAARGLELVRPLQRALFAGRDLSPFWGPVTAPGVFSPAW